MFEFAGKPSLTAGPGHGLDGTSPSGPGKQTLVDKEYGASAPQVANPGGASAGGPAASAVDPAIDPAEAYQALLAADASLVGNLLDAATPDETLKIDSGLASLILARLTFWTSLQLLREFVGELRREKVSGWLAVLLGTTTAWTYLVAVLRPADRIRLYDLLADGNLDARNTGRFTEDLVEFWDVQMREDAGKLRAAYHRLCKADEQDAVARTVEAQLAILAILTEYRALDQRYRMKGTLLSRFLLAIDDVVTIGDHQHRMLDHITNLMGDSAGRYQDLLAASHLELAGTPIEDPATLGDALAEELVAALATVDEVVATLVVQADAVQRACIRILAKTASKLPLLIEVIAENFEELGEICAIALGYLSPHNIARILQSIDVGRIWDFYKALVTLTGSALFMPQLVAAYFLLPDKTRDQLFSAIGRTAFRPLIREARQLVVPIIRDLVERYLPDGQGCYFERGLTASVGVAQAGGDSSFWVVRAGDKLAYHERFSVRGGVDVGRGAGATEGKKPGAGSQLFWGHEVAASASAMMELTTQNHYEFPIFDDDAFVGLLAAFADVEAAVALGGILFEELEQIDPLPYLKKAKLEPKLSGELNADASTGLRKGEGGDDASHTWKPGEKPEAMGSSIGAMFGAQAGAAIHQLLEVGAALELEARTENRHRVSLSLGIKQASGLRLDLPGIGLIANAVPAAVDAGTAIKLSCSIDGLAARQPELAGPWQLSLVGTTGEIDTYQGSASETEVVLATGGGALDSVPAFIASLGEATFKRRIGIATGLGKKLLAVLDHQNGFTAKLKADYQDAGLKLKGSIDFEFTLEAMNTQRIAQVFLDAIRQLSPNDAPLTRLKDWVFAFVTRGDLPDELEDAVAELGGILRASFESASYHVEIGGAVAIGERAGADRSIGGHGYAGSGWIFHGDVTEEVSALDTAELVDLITDRAARAAGAAEAAIADSFG